MEEQEPPTDPTTPEAAAAAGPPPEAPVPPPVTAEVPPATAYPPGFTPGTPPPPLGPPPLTYGWTWGPMGPPGQPPPKPARSGSWISRFVRNALAAWIVAGVLAATVIGVSVGWATSGPAARSVPFGPAGTPFGRSGFPGSGSGPGAGGFFGSAVVGTVASVSSNSFTVTARSGQTVTVDEQSTTVYYSGATQATSSIVTQGATVAVQGSRSGNTVTASRVTVLPAGGLFGAPTSPG